MISFRFARYFSAIKETTGIYGLPVNPLPIPELVQSIQKVLIELQKTIPDSSVYRQTTESLYKSRLDIINNEKDISKIEEKIGCGQIEELIIQSKDELTLLYKLREEWKPWEESKQ